MNIYQEIANLYATQVEIYRMKCKICNKPINDNTGSIYHDKCRLSQAPPPILPQHTPGAKLDHDKPRLGLVLGSFTRALMQVGKVGTMGAKKYTPNGWIKVENGVERYTDAMVRHYLTEETGEKFDPELTEMAGEDIYHAACVAWNALARLELMIRKKEAQHAQLEMDKQ